MLPAKTHSEAKTAHTKEMKNGERMIEALRAESEELSAQISKENSPDTLNNLNLKISSMKETIKAMRGEIHQTDLSNKKREKELL